MCRVNFSTTRINKRSGKTKDTKKTILQKLSNACKRTAKREKKQRQEPIENHSPTQTKTLPSRMNTFHTQIHTYRRICENLNFFLRQMKIEEKNSQEKHQVEGIAVSARIPLYFWFVQHKKLSAIYPITKCIHCSYHFTFMYHITPVGYEQLF